MGLAGAAAFVFLTVTRGTAKVVERIFFVFCFGMGKVINNALAKRDGPPNQWNQGTAEAGKTYRMQSNPAMEQQQLQQLKEDLDKRHYAMMLDHI